jgi:hypothetical protein
MIRPLPDPAAFTLPAASLVLLLACSAPALDWPLPEGDVSVATQALTGGAGLTLTGSGSQTPLAPANGFAQEWTSHFELTNTTSKSIQLTRQLFFFIAPGGWVYGKPDSTLWGWAPNQTLPPQSFWVQEAGWGLSGPVSHMILRLDGQSGTSKYSSIAAAPITAPGFPPPPSPGYTDDLDIGVIGPLEIVNLASGERWLQVTGTIVDTTNSSNQLTPSLTVSARNSSGGLVATMNTALLVPGPQDEPVLPVRMFSAWVALSASASVAKVRIQASLPIGNAIASQTKDIAVASASPLAIASPVAGVWAWNNSVGQTGLHAHTRSPEGRYAYDMCIKEVVNGQVLDCQNDCKDNTDFLCWGQPIRAVMGGTVVYAYDDTPDHVVDAQPLGKNNEIIIQHPNGYYSRYAHMQKDSIQVSVGQTVAAGTVLAVVGNAGASSGPHLHFHITKLDASNKQRGYPVLVNGLMKPDFTPVAGVPRGGTLYRTP